jgi:hypothetical protein
MSMSGKVGITEPLPSLLSYWIFVYFSCSQGFKQPPGRLSRACRCLGWPFLKDAQPPQRGPKTEASSPLRKPQMTSTPTHDDSQQSIESECGIDRLVEPSTHHKKEEGT